MSNSDFNRGYLIAVANLMNLHDSEVEAQDVLGQLGCTRAQMEKLGLTDYDLTPLRKLYDETERLAEVYKRQRALAALSASNAAQVSK